MDDLSSTVLSREPCPDCGSRDNLVRYSDGHAKCYGQGCGRFERPTETDNARPRRMFDDPYDDEPEDDEEDTPPLYRTSDLITGNYVALAARGLTEDTCRRFRYQVGKFKGQNVHLAGYCDSAGNVVAQKIRFKDKKAGMPWVGDAKKATLFGSHLFGSGKKLVITEGELDAMSVSQVQDHKWPVVSISKGAAGAAKELAQNLDYLLGFEEIILMLDNDEAGRNAANECAKILPPGRVKIAKLDLKDANEMLLARRGREIVTAIWNAQPWAPPQAVFGKAITARLKNRPKVTSFPFPDYLPRMNDMVLGIRLGSLDTWTSGSGMGKTTLLKQLQLHYHRTTPFNQAVIHLEEPLEDTAESLVGVHMRKRLTLPKVRDEVPEEEIEAAAAELFEAVDEDGNPRFLLHDAWGSVGSDEDLLNTIRYYAVAHGCKLTWIDHLSILVSSMGEEGDERRRIDYLMHSLKALSVELGIYIGLIVHLKKSSGGPSFEEGAVPSLDDLRGSGGIKQLSDSVYAMSRDQQAENAIARRTAQTHVLKSRYTGETGPADFIEFERETGCYVAGIDPELAESFGDETQAAPENAGF